MHSPPVGLDYHALLAFAGATFGETITPGPTFALILETRAAKDTRAAVEAVLGVTLANVLWVVFILWLGDKVLGASVAPLLEDFLRHIAAALLIYFATRRLLSSSVHVLTGVRDQDPRSRSRSSNVFLAAFFTHAFNPVTPTYYFSAFAIAVVGRRVEEGMAFGAVPVALDMAVYLAVARVPLPDARVGPRVAAVIRLVAGGLLLYLVAHAFSKGTVASSQLNLPGVTALLMLVGFTAGALHEGFDWVVSRRGADNRLLWRVVALWGSWFSVTGLVGALYTLIDGIDHGALAFDPLLLARIRTCLVVAGVMAVSLTWCKAFGELQDESAGTPRQGTAIRPGWVGHPVKAGAGVVGSLIVLYLLLAITGLQVK